MRTVIFILALSVHDVAVALGGQKLGDNTSFLVYIFLACMIMDVVDFVRGNK